MSINFRDEYKKSVKIISPDEEAMKRMQAAVMAKIAAEQSNQDTQQQSKRAIPFVLTRIALAGGAAAACAAITITAVMYQQNRTDSTAMMSAVESSVSIAEDADIEYAEEDAEDIAEDSAADTAIENDGAIWYDDEEAVEAATEEYADTTADGSDAGIAAASVATAEVAPSNATGDQADGAAQSGSSYDGEASDAEYASEELYDEAIIEEEETAEVDNANDSNSMNPEAGFEPSETGGTYDECAIETEEIAETADAGEIEKDNPTIGGGTDVDSCTEEVEETLPDEYIVLGASIMTYNGVRYTKISDEALVDTIASPGAYAVNIADGKYYNLSFDYTDGVITRITVCNENGSCIGTFEYNG